MKINKTFKLEKAASTDATRPAIGNVLVTKTKEGKTLAIATDGRIMAVVPCEIADDAELGLVSPKALVHGRKLAKKASDSEMTLNGNIAFLDGSALPRPTQQDCGNYPNWTAVQPDPEAKIAFTVAFDPRLLLNLAEAIGYDGSYQKSVTLRFVDEMTAIRVTCGADGQYGLLMPVRVVA